MTLTPTIADDNLPARPEVLLVDDDEVNLLLIALALRERGFRIVEADSGERALALLAEHTPDIVVLDALMPGLDGFDTCRAVRRLTGCENVPVLMLTGLDDDASITRGPTRPARRTSLSRPRSGACWPAGCNTCCVHRAPASNWNAARASWPAPKTWPAWAASTGGAAAAAC